MCHFIYRGFELPGRLNKTCAGVVVRKLDTADSPGRRLDSQLSKPAGVLGHHAGTLESLHRVWVPGTGGWVKETAVVVGSTRETVLFRHVSSARHFGRSAMICVGGFWGNWRICGWY